AELAYDIDDLNWVDDTGRTVLHIAVMHRRDKVLAPLLSAGADVNIVNEFGMTPLGLALHDGAETISRLLQNAQVEQATQPQHSNEDQDQPAPGQILSMDVHINPGIRYANLRQTPETDGRVVATAVPGTIMHVVGVSEAWVEVELDPGVRGWAHRDWLDLPFDMPAASLEPNADKLPDQEPSNDHAPPTSQTSES
ncbi:MAG: SH3 domain-containing protein, partial [Pseudomonadota bacterium]